MLSAPRPQRSGYLGCPSEARVRAAAGRFCHSPPASWCGLRRRHDSRRLGQSITVCFPGWWRAYERAWRYGPGRFAVAARRPEPLSRSRSAGSNRQAHSPPRRKSRRTGPSSGDLFRQANAPQFLIGAANQTIVEAPYSRTAAAE